MNQNKDSYISFLFLMLLLLSSALGSLWAGYDLNHRTYIGNVSETNCE